MKKLIAQLIKFGIVGVIATLIDMLCLFVLTTLFGSKLVLVWNILSFLISLVFNYILSMKYVFKAKEGLSKRNEIIIFFIFSTLGFGINELIMWIGCDLMGYKENLEYMAVKIVATMISLIFNFITKKLVLENNSKTPNIESNPEE